MKIGQPKLLGGKPYFGSPVKGSLSKEKTYVVWILPAKAPPPQEKEGINTANTAPTALEARDRLSEIFGASLFFARFHFLTEFFSRVVHL